jgi:uncharacterized protein (DUF1499 family)
MRLQEVGPVVSAVALGAALCLLALAPLGARLGWWPFGFGLYWIFPTSGMAAALGATVSLATLALCRGLGWRTLSMLSITLAVGAAVGCLPLRYAYVRHTLPAIHDITTDTDNRPPFKAVEAARALERADRIDTGEPQLSQLQRAAYPDVAPIYTPLPAHRAFDAALAVAQSMPGWIVVAAHAEEGDIEASQRSRWFGFTDDIVIRVAPDGGGTRIDMRSASRKGTSDYGVNAARIRAYMSALKGDLKGALKGALGDRVR